MKISEFLEIKESILNKIIFVLMFALVLIPTNYKAISIFIVGSVIIYYAIRRNKIINLNYLISNGMFYLVIAGTILYSENLDYASNKLQTMASLFVFPFLFSFFTFKDKQRIFNNLTTYLYIYIFSVFLFNIFVFINFFANYFSFQDTLIHLPEIVNIHLGKFNIHPIYISMHCAIAIIFSLILFIKIKTRWNKGILIFLNVILLCFLFLYAKKGPILALIITFIIYTFLNNNNKYIIYGLITVALLVLLIFLIPNTRNRFKELYKIETLSEGRINSTNMRLTILHEAKELIIESPFWGYGVGDYNDKLKEKYKEKNISVLLISNYNAHNQYLSIFLIGGIFTFIIFVFMMYNFFNLSFKDNNYILLLLLVFYSLMMLTENILEREDGVIFFSFFINFFSLKNNRLFAKK